MRFADLKAILVYTLDAELIYNLRERHRRSGWRIYIPLQETTSNTPTYLVSRQTQKCGRIPKKHIPIAQWWEQIEETYASSWVSSCRWFDSSSVWYLGVVKMVWRLIWVQEVGSSSLSTQTSRICGFMRRTFLPARVDDDSGFQIFFHFRRFDVYEFNR